MNTKHTPTPWTVLDGLSYPEPFTGIAGGNGRDPVPLNEINAAFIVRACNAHDDLVAALQTLLQSASATKAGQTDFAVWKSCSAETIGAVLNDARAALAKAQA